MVKATKATKKRLATEDFTPRVRHATLLEHIVRIAGEEGCRGTGSACYTDHGLYYLCYSDEAPYFRGLQTKYPSLIETTLTHGNNEIKIPDINKLVNAMLANR
jgi:hypothetical protein